MKLKSNSRFRNFFDIEHFQQDGEKEYLLCRKCEKKFSGYEPNVKFIDMSSNIIDVIKYNYLYKNKIDRFISDELKLLFKDCIIPQAIKNKEIMEQKPEIKESIVKAHNK